ncbi:MAG: hypothetical protein ACOC5F_06270 [Candidatus Aminicenantaceae bacterium]
MTIEREDKNPWTKWFWQDWLADTNIKASSLAAKGLWIEMLAIMSKSEKKGFLLINGKQIKSKLLAKLVGEDEVIVEELLNELKENGVYSIDESGVIYCRRMARETKLSKIRSEAGKLGGRPKKQNKSKNKSKRKALSASASASASASKYKSSKKHLDEAKYLESAIKETNPKHTIRGKQYLEDWANTFRIMEEKKEASLEEIRMMIDFAMSNSFWHSNILSAGKLREKFGRLWEQAKEKGKVKSDLQTGQRSKESTPDEAEYWKAREGKEMELEKQGLSEDEIQAKIASWSQAYWKTK